MTREQYLLTKLAEECMEVGQRATKALTFGISEIQDGQNSTNAERILHEFADLLGVMEMLVDEEILVIDEVEMLDRIEHKKAKVERYYGYSQSLGIVA